MIFPKVGGNCPWQWHLSATQKSSIFGSILEPGSRLDNDSGEWQWLGGDCGECVLGRMGQSRQRRRLPKSKTIDTFQFDRKSKSTFALPLCEIFFFEIRKVGNIFRLCRRNVQHRTWYVIQWNQDFLTWCNKFCNLSCAVFYLSWGQWSPLSFLHVSCWLGGELYPTSYQANYLMKQLRGRLRSGSQPLISRTTIRPLAPS